MMVPAKAETSTLNQVIRTASLLTSSTATAQWRQHTDVRWGLVPFVGRCGNKLP